MKLNKKNTTGAKQDGTGDIIMPRNYRMLTYPGYDPDTMLPLVQGWARDGLTNRQIAKNLGISERTLYKWRDKYPELAEALKKGKEVADREVENALFKRATGYEYKEVTIEYIETEVNGQKTPAKKVKEVTKHVLPDVTAQIFWLCNRSRDTKKWQHVNRVEHVGEGGGNIVFEVKPPPPPTPELPQGKIIDVVPEDADSD